MQHHKTPNQYYILTDSLLMSGEITIGKYVLQLHRNRATTSQKLGFPLHSNVDYHLILVWATSSQKKYGLPLHSNVDYHLILVWTTTSQKMGFRFTKIWILTSQKCGLLLDTNMGPHFTITWFSSSHKYGLHFTVTRYPT